MNLLSRYYFDRISLKFTAAVLTFLLMQFSPAAYSQSESFHQLVGTWEVYKDEERNGKTLPKEAMSFWANGVFEISGDHPHKGLYRIKASTMEMLIKLGDRSLRLNREFKIKNGELLFKNPNVGWVYYKQISEVPMGNEPDFNQ